MRIAPKALYYGEGHQQTALKCHRWQPPESCKVNTQNGVEDSKYVVICDAPTLGLVIRRIRIAPKMLYNGEANQQTALNCQSWQPTESCKVNRQYGVGDSKYVVICDPPTLDHVIRRIRIAPETLYNKEAHQQTAPNCHRSQPLKFEK